MYVCIYVKEKIKAKQLLSKTCIIVTFSTTIRIKQLKVDNLL